MISVICPTHNHARLLGRCLDTLAELPAGVAEVIVVDDGSTDDTPELCRKWSAADPHYRRYLRLDLNQGAPVAILEAMARGLPVISNLHSGIPHLVRDGVTGLLSAKGDTTAMAKNLIRLAEQPLVRQRMGCAGRKRAGNFTWDREREVLQRLLFDSF